MNVVELEKRNHATIARAFNDKIALYWGDIENDKIVVCYCCGGKHGKGRIRFTCVLSETYSCNMFGTWNVAGSRRNSKQFQRHWYIVCTCRQWKEHFS